MEHIIKLDPEDPREEKWEIHRRRWLATWVIGVAALVAGGIAYFTGWCWIGIAAVVLALVALGNHVFRVFPYYWEHKADIDAIQKEMEQDQS